MNVSLTSNFQNSILRRALHVSVDIRHEPERRDLRNGKYSARHIAKHPHIKLFVNKTTKLALKRRFQQLSQLLTTRWRPRRNSKFAALTHVFTGKQANDAKKVEVRPDASPYGEDNAVFQWVRDVCGSLHRCVTVSKKKAGNKSFVLNGYTTTDGAVVAVAFCLHPQTTRNRPQLPRI